MLVFLKHSIELITKIMALAGGFIILFVGAILFVEVVLRTAGYPTEWIPEWSIYLFSWAMIGGAAYTLHKGRHVRVELLMMHLPPVWRNLLDIGTSLVGASLCALIAFHGWEHLQDILLTGETTSTALRVPLWLTDSPIFFGFALLALQFLLLSAEKILALLLLKKFDKPRGAKKTQEETKSPESEAGAA